MYGHNHAIGMSEATKSAVLAKCGDVANVILDNDWSVAKSPTIAGKFYMEQGDSENFLTLSEDLPADAWQWGVAADILKITPSIDEFEDDLSRRQYRHDLEVARKEGYENGVSVTKAIANITNGALGLPYIFVDGEAVEVKKAPRPSDALLWECWEAAWVKLFRMTYREHVWDKMDKGVIKYDFDKWLETLPADPLQTDRELVRSCLICSIDGIPQFVPIDNGDKTLFQALKRVLGLEVGNGN